MQRLRYALLFDGRSLEEWHVRCLDRLESVAELAGVFVAEAEQSPGPTRSASPALQRHAWRLAQGSRVGAEQLPGGQKPEPSALDFILRLGSVATPPAIADSARHGVWCFEHETLGDLPPFFREVYDGEDVTRAVLVSRSKTGDVLVLEEGYFPTQKRSYTASRERVVGCVAAWPARVCEQLLSEEGHGSSVRKPYTSLPSAASKRRRLLVYKAKIAGRRLGLAWQRLFRHPQWNIGVIKAPVETLLAPGAYAAVEIEWFPLEGRRGFLADPFGAVRDGTLHVLCEYFGYRENKGQVSTLAYTDAGFTADVQPAIALPVHASYPMLFDDADQIYCVPETSAANEVALFRAAEFPHSWTKTAVILENFAGVDPTVFRHDGRWWLMCTRSGVYEDVELWLWHALELEGPWTQHARNPVKTDVRGARPGGAPFVHEERLFRPAQDCSKTYGGRIAIQQVTRLTPTEFDEEPAAVLETSAQSPFPCGPHTLTSLGDLVLIDGRRTVFVWRAFLAFLAIWASDVTTRSYRGRRT